MRLQYIGRPKTWRDADTGQLVSDLDSIHRTDALEGDFDEFGADYDDFDEFGDDSDEDFGDDDTTDDDDSDDDDSDEDFGEDDEEDFGRSRGRRRRQARRGRRRSRRKSRRSKRRGGSSQKRKKKVIKQKTILSGSASEGSSGALTVTITPGHKFWAEDIAFNGSSEGATVTSITFGDNLIWNNADGVDVSALSTSSFIRGLVKGAKGHPGVPIIINGTIAAGGDTLKVVLTGYKPSRRC